MSDENLRPVVRDATLEIYDECDPVLETGKTYPVTVGQQAVELRPGGKEETLLSVSGSVYVKIVGPRVRLDPADIAGVYPAAGSDSSPDEYLPHVALVRRTLPWERNGPVVDHPWMALIVLSEDELRTARASADGEDFALLRLLFGGVRDDDGADFLVFLDTADENAIMQRPKSHGCVSLNFGVLFKINELGLPRRQRRAVGTHRKRVLAAI